MSKSRNLFICATQYQLLNCLGIASGMSKNEVNDFQFSDQGNNFFKQLNLEK